MSLEIRPWMNWSKLAVIDEKQAAHWIMKPRESWFWQNEQHRTGE